MRQRYNVGRVTRADVLVTAALCGFVLLMVPPLFSRSREHHERILCSANLAQIGQAMLIYAEDYDGALPRSGGPTTQWGQTRDWTAVDRYCAFGISRIDESGGTATISSCFYLLVKYMEVPTRTFVCQGDKGTTEFKLSELMLWTDFELSEAWDFGPSAEAFTHCSYAYHMPFDPCALTTARDPNFAVAADRNPWITSPSADAGCFADFVPDLPMYGGLPTMARVGNTAVHQKDGQNVLFVDGSVRFETRSYCGVENEQRRTSDNIYTLSCSFADGDPLGQVPTPPASGTNEFDSVLVHDPPAFSGGIRRDAF